MDEHQTSARRLGLLALACFAAVACTRPAPGPGAAPGAEARAVHRTALVQLNDGACRPGQAYVQEPLREPMKIAAAGGRLETELLVALRKRCVPVWVPAGSTGAWQMQTLEMRTYGFPRDPNVPVTEADANDPASPKIAWSSPGPTFVVEPASAPGATDGTRIKVRLYNRMPFEADPHGCVSNLKCNTSGPNAGVDPATGQCRQPIDSTKGGFAPQIPGQRVDAQVVEPPNCFHGLNSTNLHFHGFHVSPQAPQDNVGLELRPPVPAGQTATHAAHGSHGAGGLVAYGHYDLALDPLRYTQAPGTHWYHAHKHGATALHVLNGQIGAFEVRGEFDRRLEDYFNTKGGGALADRLLVVQQLQERQPGLGGADQTAAVLINGQGNPIVRMKRGEIQRWRFVGATMQASAALRIGFPSTSGRATPRVRQIAMDGVQFSPDNYDCQPLLNNADCTAPAQTGSFNELTAFNLSPGNRVDVLIQAPDTAGAHCLLLDVTTRLAEGQKARERHAARAAVVHGTCGVLPKGLGPLLTLVVDAETRPMTFPARADFPPLPAYLADLPPVNDPARQRAVHYEMVEQGHLAQTQFFINQSKYDGNCANETLVLDRPEQWTLWNNSLAIAHPFHIHQNPFQLVSQSDRVTPQNPAGKYKYPLWRDVMPIPTAASAPTDSASSPPSARAPNSAPRDPQMPWGNAVIVYVAKEFTGGFVNHCHILGHEDRGMMHNTQATCADGRWAATGPVPASAKCDAAGFCASDCELGLRIAATPACAVPPAQRSDWPVRYGIKP